MDKLDALVEDLTGGDVDKVTAAAKSIVALAEDKNEDEESVFIFLKECGIKDEKALLIAELLEDYGFDEVQTLMDLLEDSVEDFNEVLGEAGEMMVKNACLMESLTN
ncbi:hypothetical protein TrCOL_g11656 [Triparma columacea]|uniref:Uncharacterized protein n=1 Tax=Triparma columacea TaxID=722753 RepID=A0A9W7GE71_9STRA|nr:hypothetical protein TrCOL_g11656 [Triparma columacea]